MPDPLDYISGLSSLVAALVALVTLFTVYIAALQLLSQRQIYRFGLSSTSLGPWKPKVVTSSYLGLRSNILTPTVNLPNLLSKDWSPQLKMPTGWSAPENHPTDLERSSESLRKVSWVNFMEALGLSPESEGLYEMQFESDLINGVVPMRWKGKDLVGMAAMLGFQSSEAAPNWRLPMQLPIQWSGPLGWLQFRSGADGCVVEYRRRGDLPDQIDSDFHAHYRPKDGIILGRFRPRIALTIGCYCLSNNKMLFLGGFDKDAADELRKPTGITEHSTEDVCQELDKGTFSDEEIRQKLWGTRTEEPKPTNEEEKADVERAKMRKYKEVLQKSPGRMSQKITGELAFSRGIDTADIYDYFSTMVHEDEVDREKYPYSIGNMQMDRELLPLVKDALSVLKPDGFFFCPNHATNVDVAAFYRHVRITLEISSKGFIQPLFADRIFISMWQPNYTELFHAIELCKSLQQLRRTARTIYSVDDMRIIAKASISARKIMGKCGEELVWAMLVCSEFFVSVQQRFATINNAELVSLLALDIQSEEGVLDTTPLEITWGGNGTEPGKFKIPLMKKDTFSGP